MTDLKSLRQQFIARFAAEPSFYRAPGRVNLIGEHTDYNAGYVMPAAIQFYTTVAIAPRSDQRLRMHSTNFEETVERPLAASPAQPGHAAHWADYITGVAQVLLESGLPLRGADLMIHGEVPLGSGLSSSAALEVAVALALSSLAGRMLMHVPLAQLCQRAENVYVGNRCGIMDQFASACGRAGHALFIDCRSLDFTLVPLQQELASVRLVICNTMVRHQLAGSEYNRRREECEQGVRALAKVAPGIEALRDVTVPMLRAHREALDPLIFQRCWHIVTENARVCASAAALQAADLDSFGEMMGESHRSLRDDYQVSCDELDLMVRLADQVPGVYGARMTGGGFGGCTVNLVQKSAVPYFSAQVTDGYARATGHRPEIYVCEAVDGAAAVSIQ